MDIGRSMPEMLPNLKKAKWVIEDGWQKGEEDDEINERRSIGRVIRNSKGALGENWESIGREVLEGVSGVSGGNLKIKNEQKSIRRELGEYWERSIRRERRRERSIRRESEDKNERRVLGENGPFSFILRPAYPCTEVDQRIQWIFRELLFRIFS